MIKKIASILVIYSFVFFYPSSVLAQLDTTPPPITETDPVEETIIPPADTTAPIISGVTNPSLGINDATIVWSTNEVAVSTLEYGITNAYGQSVTLPLTALLAHTATLTGLSAGTTYYYCIHATDVAGNTSSSCGHVLTTQAEVATEPVLADSDIDGISDVNEIGTDVVEESIPEAVVTNPEAFPDTDADTVPNYLDPDDDGDGIPTAEEEVIVDGETVTPDADADSIPDYLEPNTTDTDNDGITNNLDPDDDNDGVPTKNEKGDSDKDLLPDYIESNTRDLDDDGKKDVTDNEDDGDGILSQLDSNPYSQDCYVPAEIGYRIYVVLPNGIKLTASQHAKKTVLSDNILRYDFELGTDNDFNDLAVRVNDEGHRSFIATIMRTEVGARNAVHLQILGNGQVENDVTLWTNPRSVVNIPQQVMVNQYMEICNDQENVCPAYITKYMKKGANNDPVEVSKLQSFLLEKEGFTSVEVNSVFDDATDAAVRAFQEKYSNIILGPWAILRGTGYVYRTTTKRINDLYCAAKQ